MIGGQVRVLVAAASPGSGASIAATAMFDAAGIANVTAALLDLADPARSGLLLAGAREETLSGTAVGMAPLVRSWRAGMPLIRAGAAAAGQGPGVLGSPTSWLRHTQQSGLVITDLGHDVWPVLRQRSHPVAAWLDGHISTHVIVVARASAPGVRSSETVVSELLHRATATPSRERAPRPPVSVSLALMGGTNAHREQLARTASPSLSPLIHGAVQLPSVGSVGFEGVEEKVLPPELVAAGRLLLQAAGALPMPATPTRRRRFFTSRT